MNLDLIGSPTDDKDDISIGSDALQDPFLFGEVSPGRRIFASFALVCGTRRAHVQEEVVKLGDVRGSMNGWVKWGNVKAFTLGNGTKTGDSSVNTLPCLLGKISS